MCEILFSSTDIRLKDDDFTLEEYSKLNLKTYRTCCMVLFHDCSDESNFASKIWNDIMKSVAGPLFMSCDLVSNKKVSSIMASPGQNPGQPWINLSRVPIIFVYRNGILEGVYNGIISKPELINYAATMACNTEYHECIIKPLNIPMAQNSNITIE